MHPTLENEWNRLEELRHFYEETLREASPARQQFKPHPDAWNMLQVVRHLVTAEELSTAFLVKKNYTNTRKAASIGTRFRALLLRIMLRSPLKFKAPPIAALQPALEQDKESILTDWESGRERLKTYLENFPADKLRYEIYRHPRSGWLTIAQALQFYGDHLKHHQQQLSRLRKDNTFPA
jgi:hypothetical protein